MDIETKLEELLINFSYYNFIDLLKEIDKKPNISEKAQQLLYSIFQMTNDNYLYEGKPGTLGQMILEQKLINKEKITPSLLMYFCEEQLEKVNVLKLPILFERGNYQMCHNYDEKTKVESIYINLSQFDNIEKIDEYN